MPEVDYDDLLDGWQCLRSPVDSDVGDPFGIMSGDKSLTVAQFSPEVAWGEGWNIVLKVDPGNGKRKIHVPLSVRAAMCLAGVLIDAANKTLAESADSGGPVE